MVFFIALLLAFVLLKTNIWIESYWCLCVFRRLRVELVASTPARPVYIRFDIFFIFRLFIDGCCCMLVGMHKSAYCASFPISLVIIADRKQVLWLILLFQRLRVEIHSFDSRSATVWFRPLKLTSYTIFHVIFHVFNLFSAYFLFYALKLTILCFECEVLSLLHMFHDALWWLQHALCASPSKSTILHVVEAHELLTYLS